jgi:hypothetical protein
MTVGSEAEVGRPGQIGEERVEGLARLTVRIGKVELAQVEGAQLERVVEWVVERIVRSHWGCRPL